MNKNVDFKGKDGSNATKEEERAALAKIKKIIEGLGEGSYIDWAFDGIIDLAERNIENDSAESMKEALEAERHGHQAEIERSAELDKKIEELEKKVEYLDRQYGIKDRRVADLLAEQDDWSDLVTQVNNEKAGLREELKATKQENLELKAKLYDMITKEEKR